MKPEELLEQLDDQQIAKAIAAAELRTSGEIRVCISHRARKDALGAARAKFDKLGMNRTRRRNAVLLYFVPLTRRFAVWADVGVHQKCGDSYWQEVVAGMVPSLVKGQFTEAVVRAVNQIGEVLGRHFPPDPEDRNELPDGVVKD